MSPLCTCFIDLGSFGYNSLFHRTESHSLLLCTGRAGVASLNCSHRMVNCVTSSLDSLIPSLGLLSSRSPCCQQGSFLPQFSSACSLSALPPAASREDGHVAVSWLPHVKPPLTMGTCWSYPTIWKWHCCFLQAETHESFQPKVKIYISMVSKF